MRCCGAPPETTDARARSDDRGCTFLFELCQSSIVDAMRLASKSRWLNQSKGADANCSSYVYWVRGDPHVAIFAKRDVRAGEELCFDYGAVFQRDNGGGGAAAGKGARSRSPDVGTAARPPSPQSTSSGHAGGGEGGKRRRLE